MPMTPIPPFPALSDRANGTYNGKAFDWASHMANTFVTEANALAANLNSIAAGGAYAIPYAILNPGSPVGSAGGGKMAFDANFTQLFIDTKSSAGKGVAALLASLASSTSAKKAALRVVKLGDSSVFTTFDITGYSADPGGLYAIYSVTPSPSNPAYPFSNDDPVILQFTRTGDKGDTGPMPVYPYAHFSEQYPSGTGGPPTGTGTIDRALNTTNANSIPGLTFASGAVSIDAGTYEFRGISLVTNNANSKNKALLYNVTDGTYLASGTSNSCVGSSSNCESHISGRFTIASRKTIRLRTHVGLVASTFGYPGEGGFSETYANLELWKLA